MLATAVLALALSQGCPEPPSRTGPPPCAASNVPGCLPGYVRDYDQYGRVIYRCDPNYNHAPPLAYAPAPPPQPLPPAAPYPPPYAAPVPAPRPEPRGVIALVLTPGVTTERDRTGNAIGTGGIALELRGQTGGGRLRLGFESMSFGSVAEAALKYDFNDHGEIRPFLAIGAGAASVDHSPDWHFEASGSVGVDLYPTRNFFLTLELKQRVFTHQVSGPNFGLEQSGLPQTAFFFGAGIYL